MSGQALDNANSLSLFESMLVQRHMLFLRKKFSEAERVLDGFVNLLRTVAGLRDTENPVSGRGIKEDLDCKELGH